MMALPLVLLAVMASILQVGAVHAAFGQPLAAPLLPVALLAGWAAIRRPREAWPAPLAAAVVLGGVSDLRVGAFLLALVPVLAIATAIRLRERRGEATLLRRLALAAVAASLGTACYVLILSAAAGTTPALSEGFVALTKGMAWTAAIATILAAAMWRARTDSGGLFA